MPGLDKPLDGVGLAQVNQIVNNRLAKKQNKLTGQRGQVVGFNATGSAVAQDADSLAGAPGKSAYEYAVDGGYTGSESEFAKMLSTGPWLSMAGTTITVEKKRIRNVGAPVSENDAVPKKYVDELVQQAGGGVPSGCILIWSGFEDNIPDGWVLCDGENGTPDLQDKFVLGAGYGDYWAWEEGGEEEVTLTEEQMPAHTHMNTTMQAASYDQKTQSGGNSPKCGGTIIESSPAGGSQPHNNMPPYFALCYIMKR